MVFLSYAKYLFFPSQNYGFGEPKPIKSLKDSVDGKLVFVRQDLGRKADLYIDRVIQNEGLKGTITVDRSEELLNACVMNLQGSSSCYAAVVFLNRTNGLTRFDTRTGRWKASLPSNTTTIQYQIVVNPSLRSGAIDIKNANSPIQSHIAPLQYALDRAIAPEAIPATPPQLWGYSKTRPQDQERFINEAYMRAVARFLYPGFFIGLIGILYHLPGLFVAEREIGITSLLTAHGCTRLARYLSWHLGLSALYLPGWLIGSIFFAVKLFTNSNPGIIIGFQLLSGLSMTSFAIFCSAFFRRAQLASVFTATISMLLAVVPVVLTFNTGWTTANPNIFIGLSAVFPPVNYISFLSCFAGWEAGGDAIVLSQKINRVVLEAAHIRGPAVVWGLLYWGFAIIHIFLFPILAVIVEDWMFAVERGGQRVQLETQERNGVAPLGIRITNFTKQYKKGVKAVDNLTFKVYKGQIMCLLGSNGSGKTTTLQAIAGIGGITSGKIEIAGLKGSGGSLSGVGVCPQGNVLWDSLTVEEHVKLWANIKCASDTKFDDGEIIAECDLWKKRNARSATLSGGMKRKLQLAIMLVGGVEVCCMDEVSSGLDPLSRLKIHEIILANRGRRTIIFTTHFLDEADFLSDYIAMISKGQLQCQGSPATIKSRFGDGYKVTTAVPVDGQIEWTVKDASDVAPVLQHIEAEGVEDYKVEAPTLEQAFLNVVADAQLREKQRDISDTDSTDVEEDDALNAKFRPLDLSSGTESNFWREIKAIYVKRWMIIRRSYIPVIAAIAIPVAVAIATRSLIAGYEKDDCLRPDTPNLTNLTNLKNLTNLAKRQTVVPNEYQFMSGFLNNKVLLGPENFWGEEEMSTVEAMVGDYIYLVPMEMEKDLSAFKTEIKKDFQEIPLGVYYDTAGKDDTIALNMELPLYYSAMPLNFFNQLRINQSGSDVKIQAQVAYFARRDFTPPGLGWALIFIFFFGFAMALAASFPTLYPTFERVRKVRSLHYSNGVRPASLWLGHLLYESVWLILAGIICGVLFAELSPDNWYHAGFLILVFALFGIASSLLSFVISLFAKSSLAAFPAMAGMNSVMHTVFTVIYMVLFTVGSADALVGAMDSSFYALGLAFPIANLDRALFVSLNMFSIACNAETAANRGNAGLRKNPGAFDLYGGPIFYLILQSCVFYAFLVWWENGRPIPHRKGPVRVYNSYDKHPRANDSLVVSGLCKTFGSHTAVDNVSFAVQRDETFCLLGPNGAGKTTSISLILGELSPDGGDVFVNGHSISRHRSQARNFLGVCPQFDAIDNLTVSQTLKFYATVKGVDRIAHNVGEIVRAVGLEAFINRKADALSGGNRRKLSLGIALMGNPAVMLLDEPSSGMDAAAKRIMWRTLRAVSAGRAIVLTTHSMEESDALASRVGILGGKMLALGTIAELRKQHGAFHYIHLVHARAPHVSLDDMETVKHWAENTFGVFIPHGKQAGALGQLKFRVEEERWKVRDVFRVLGEAKEKVGVGEFSVQSTSLEEVFLEVSRRYEVEKGERRGEAV